MVGSLHNLQEQIWRVQDLPVREDVAKRAAELSLDPEIRADVVAHELERDPFLSLQVVRLANSERFGGGRVANVLDAIIILGMPTLRRFLAIARTYPCITDGDYAFPFRARSTWVTAYAFSAATALIVGSGSPENRLEARSVAHLLQAGRLTLSILVENPRRNAPDTSQNLRIPLVVAESELWGVHHGEAAALLGEAWGLPASWGRVCRSYAASRVPQNEAWLWASLRLAGFLVQTVGLDYGFQDRKIPCPLALETLGWTTDDVDVILNEFVTQVDEYERGPGRAA